MLEPPHTQARTRARTHTHTHRHAAIERTCGEREAKTGHGGGVTLDDVINCRLDYARQDRRQNLGRDLGNHWVDALLL